MWWRSRAGRLCQGHKEHRIRSVPGLEGTLKIISLQCCVMDKALRAVGIVPQGLALLTLCRSSCRLQPQKEML